MTRKSTSIGMSEKLTGDKSRDQQIIFWQNRAIFLLVTVLINIGVWYMVNVPNYTTQQDLREIREDLVSNPPIVRQVPSIRSVMPRIEKLEYAITEFSQRQSLMQSTQQQIRVSVEELKGTLLSLSKNLQQVELSIARTQQGVSK